MKQHFNRENVFCLLLVVLFLTCSVFIDAEITCQQSAAVCTQLMKRMTTFVPQFFGYKAASDFAIGLAFSLLISRIVYIIVGNATDKSIKEFMNGQDSFVKSTINEISKNAFVGAFGASFPQRYIDEILRTSITRPLYRTGFEARYTLLNPASGHGVIMHANIRHRTINCGKRDESITPGLVIDAIKTKEFIENTNIESIKVDGIELLTEHLRNRFLNQLKNEKSDNIEIRTKSINIPPGQHVDLEVIYSILKNFHDNEVHRSILPTDGLTVYVTDETGRSLKVGASTVHRAPFHLDNFGLREAEKKWELKTPTLPHNGYVVYWMDEVLQRKCMECGTLKDGGSVQKHGAA